MPCLWQALQPSMLHVCATQAHHCSSLHTEQSHSPRLPCADLGASALQLFAHVIAYLRAVHYHEPEPDLPRGAANLELLVREANFYALPGLAQAAQVLHRTCTCCCCTYRVPMLHSPRFQLARVSLCCQRLGCVPVFSMGKQNVLRRWV